MESEDEITEKKIKELKIFLYALPENCSIKTSSSINFSKPNPFYDGDYFKRSSNF